MSVRTPADGTYDRTSEWYAKELVRTINNLWFPIQAPMGTQRGLAQPTALKTCQDWPPLALFYLSFLAGPRVSGCTSKRLPGGLAPAARLLYRAREANCYRVTDRPSPLPTLPRSAFERGTMVMETLHCEDGGREPRTARCISYAACRGGLCPLPTPFTFVTSATHE